MPDHRFSQWFWIGSKSSFPVTNIGLAIERDGVQHTAKRLLQRRRNVELVHDRRDVAFPLGSRAVPELAIDPIDKIGIDKLVIGARSHVPPLLATVLLTGSGKLFFGRQRFII